MLFLRCANNVSSTSTCRAADEFLNRRFLVESLYPRFQFDRIEYPLFDFLKKPVHRVKRVWQLTEFYKHLIPLQLEISLSLLVRALMTGDASMSQLKTALTEHKHVYEKVLDATLFKLITTTPAVNQSLVEKIFEEVAVLYINRLTNREECYVFECFFKLQAFRNNFSWSVPFRIPAPPSATMTPKVLKSLECCCLVARFCLTIVSLIPVS